MTGVTGHKEEKKEKEKGENEEKKEEKKSTWADGWAGGPIKGCTIGPRGPKKDNGHITKNLKQMFLQLKQAFRK